MSPGCPSRVSATFPGTRASASRSDRPKNLSIFSKKRAAEAGQAGRPGSGRARTGPPPAMRPLHAARPWLRRRTVSRPISQNSPMSRAMTSGSTTWPTKKEEPLTSGGSEELMNGKTDWVYPEELSQREAFWWSPDGQKIAYLQFDERAVYNFPIIHELTPDRKPAFETTLELERYPKAGQAQPDRQAVRHRYRHRKNRRNARPKARRTSTSRASPGAMMRRELFFQRLNRFQNRLELKAADPATGDVRTRPGRGGSRASSTSTMTSGSSPTTNVSPGARSGRAGSISISTISRASSSAR